MDMYHCMLEDMGAMSLKKIGKIKIMLQRIERSFV